MPELNLKALYLKVQELQATHPYTHDDSDYYLNQDVEDNHYDIHTPYTAALVDWTGFFARDFNARDWLVEPLLVRGRSHALIAGAKTGKSLLMLEVAAALATGRPVLQQAAQDPIHVLYVDHEMTDVDLFERLTALGYGDNDEHLLRNYLHYTQLPSSLPLDTEQGGLELAYTAANHDAEVVIIDTFSRAVRGRENDADTAQDFYRQCGKILKKCGVTVIRLDHLGKDGERGGRGSSAKNDDVDVVWKLTGGGDHLTLEATHQRVGWIPRGALHIVRHEEYGTLTHRLLAPVLDGESGPDRVTRLLEEHNVPAGASIRQAARALQAATGTRPNTTNLEAAVRLRKAGAPD